MAKAKEAEKPDTIYVKDPELSEYERMKNFLLWTLGIVGGSIAVIVAVALFFTYGSINDLKSEVSSRVGDMKTEVSGSVGDMKSDIRDLKDYASGTLEDTELKAEKRLDFIERQAEVTAMLRVQELFMSNRIQEQFEMEARKVFDKKLELVADEKVNELSQKLSEQLSIQPKLSLALDRIRNGDRKGLEFLDSLISNSSNEEVVVFARFMREEKCKDYESVFSDAFAKVKMEDLYLFNDIPLYLLDTINDERKIDSLVLNINRERDLQKITFFIFHLRKLAGQKFELFDFRGINKWYRSHKNQKM